jgi:16S rRNA (guanine(966)-N(2))-methyltransferase RsmD
MRVIAGKFGRRLLRGPRDLKLRPTSDKLRETLFNILGGRVEGAVFVDVFAGTGAVGIEALSRGAREVVFIEKHAKSAELIRRNVQSLGAGDEVTVLAMEAKSALGRIASQGTRANFVFLDPPYADYDAAITSVGTLDAAGLPAPGGEVILEHARKEQSPERIGRFVRYRVLEQGDSGLSFYRLTEESSDR